MKKLFILILLTLVSFNLFAGEVLYQKQHKDFDSITVVSFIKSDDNWYLITIVYADNKDAVNRYMIYNENKEVMQDLLFSFEKQKDYVNQIEKMEKNNSLVFIKEDTGIQDNIILYTKHYMYMK